MEAVAKSYVRYVRDSLPKSALLPSEANPLLTLNPVETIESVTSCHILSVDDSASLISILYAMSLDYPLITELLDVVVDGLSYCWLVKSIERCP